MLFEAITITMLSVLWSAWKTPQDAKADENESKQDAEPSENVSEQPTSHLMDEHLTVRRNECFLQVYAIMIAPEKSRFQQLTTLFKQLACIYSISSKIDTKEISAKGLHDFESYVRGLKESDVAIKRLKELQPLLEYSFREIDKGVFVKYYFLDQGKDEDYIENVMKNFYGRFDIILQGESSKSSDESNESQNDAKISNYDCLVGTAGDVYDNLVKFLYDYKLLDSRKRVNHELVYEMAEYILAKTHFYFCKGLTTERLAKDITDSIIHYLHNNVEIKEEFKDKYGTNKELFVEKLIERYLMNREIESYYYFLKMACKVLEALHYKSSSPQSSSEDEGKISIAMKKLSKLDLPILGNYEYSDIEKDIEEAFNSRNVVCNIKERQ